MKKMMLVLALIGMTSACTWVKVSEDATTVAVANKSNVRGCELVRTVHVKVKDSLGPINRNDDKVATELANMARNEATNFGGDTVVPTTAVQDGRQTFDVYKCK